MLICFQYDVNVRYDIDVDDVASSVDVYVVLG
jgi:hypothetical protein